MFGKEPHDVLDEADPSRDRRGRRRVATREEIVEAAWALCREHGLAGLAMRDLAATVGLSAASMYSYFDSKDAIYDAMFRQGNVQLAEHMRPYYDGPVTLASFAAAIDAWVAFCVADPVRYQLMFQRTLPGFEPSPESYAMAVAHVGELQRALRAVGLDSDGAADLFTAMLTGITSQQIANDPGGDRWTRLVPAAVELLLSAATPADDHPLRLSIRSRSREEPR